MAKVKGFQHREGVKKKTSIGMSKYTNPKNKNAKSRFKRSRGQG